MKNLKTLAITATIALTSIFAGPAAEAAKGHCYTTTNGGDVCITGVWSAGNNYKTVDSVVNGHYTRETIYCNPAHRFNYKENMAGIACFQFN